MQPTNSTIITDVSQATWKYLWTNSRPKLIMASAGALLGTAFLIIFAHGTLFIAPAVLFGLWYQKISKRLEAQFVQQFADANNFSFCPGDVPAQINGRPFSEGRDHTFDDLVKGSIDNLPFEYFAFNYVTGYGRNRTVHTLTVLAVDLGHPLPPIYAQSLRAGQTASLSQALFARLETPIGAHAMTFGNDFDKYYRLNIEPHAETQTLQIFEPDLMANLIDQPVHFDFELGDSTLYIYTEGRVTKKAVLDSFIAFARAFAARLERETSNLDLN